MTIQKLAEIKKLDNLIRGLEHQKQIVKEKATSATSNLSGVPHRKGKTDIVGDCAAELAELTRALQNARRKRQRLTEYIYNIKDEYIKNVLILKFIKGYTWQKCAFVIGTATDGDGLRMMCGRFLSRSETR